MKLKIEYVPRIDLVTYENNAKIHTGEQIEQIKNSIQQFGFNDPIAVWKGNVIIEGHGRLIAAEELGIEIVPIIRLDNLTDEQRRAYTLVHNKLTMNTGFDFDMLNDELESLSSIDMSEFGFEIYSEGDEETNTVDHSEVLQGTYQIIIDCEDEQQMEEYYDIIREQGIECRTSTL